jgi:hypothetical protein
METYSIALSVCSFITFPNKAPSPWFGLFCEKAIDNGNKIIKNLRFLSIIRLQN